MCGCTRAKNSDQSQPPNVNLYCRWNHCPRSLMVIIIFVWQRVRDHDRLLTRWLVHETETRVLYVWMTHFIRHIFGVSSSRVASDTVRLWFTSFSVTNTTERNRNIRCWNSSSTDLFLFKRAPVNGTHCDTTNAIIGIVMETLMNSFRGKWLPGLFLLPSWIPWL